MPPLNIPLAEMLRYNRWATLTLLEACRDLTPEQLAAQPPGISATIGHLLVHFAGSQRTFVNRITSGTHDGDFSRREPWPGIDAVIAAARASADDLVAIAESLDTDREVDLPYMGKTYRFPVSFFLVHAMEHGVEHRTEIKVALNQLGLATPDLDGWSYASAAGFGQEV
jgi:uncharacterized damage-inducible protein DinB